MDSYRGKVSPEEALLNPGPDGDGDDQQLVLVLQVSEGRHQQLDPGELLGVLGSLVLPEPGERIHEDGNDDGGGQGAGQVDAGDDVDLGDVGLEVVLGVRLVLLPRADGLAGTEGGAAELDVVIREKAGGVQSRGEHGGADDVPDDGVALEEEEEDGEELDDDELRGDPLQLGHLVGHLVEVGALGAPHGGRAQPQDEGGGDERVEGGVELGRHVGGVAEDTDHQGPLHLQILDEDARHEHAGEDQADVDRGGGPGTQIVNLEVKFGQVQCKDIYKIAATTCFAIAKYLQQFVLCMYYV